MRGTILIPAACFIFWAFYCPVWATCVGGCQCSTGAACVCATGSACDQITASYTVTTAYTGSGRPVLSAPIRFVGRVAVWPVRAVSHVRQHCYHARQLRRACH